MARETQTLWKGHMQWLDKCVWARSELQEAQLFPLHSTSNCWDLQVYFFEKDASNPNNLETKFISVSSERSTQLHGCWLKSQTVH